LNDVVDGADAAVVGRRGRLRLSEEALPGALVVTPLTGKKFQRDRAVVSLALYTTPIPPPPSLAVIS